MGPSNDFNSRVQLTLTIVGGDFNVILDEVLDRRGGNKKRKESAKYVEELCVEHDLIDIWRIRNPSETRITWCQKTPIIQRSLDYWLVSDCLQVNIDTVDITTAIKSDHSAITLGRIGLDESVRGPSFWKFNSNLVNDPDYCQLISCSIRGNPKTRKPESGFRNRKPESGIWNLEFLNRNPESGIRNQESTNQRKQVLQIRKNYLAELLPVENKSSNTRTFRNTFALIMNIERTKLRRFEVILTPLSSDGITCSFEIKYK